MNKGFECGFVPKRLIVNDRPELSNFPLNILFASVVEKDNQTAMADALYEPDFSSFKEEIDEDGKEKQIMNYRNKYGPQWRVEIWYFKERKSYFGLKYSGSDDESKGGASGSQWGAFFSHLTILGLADGEPCSFQTARIAARALSDLLSENDGKENQRVNFMDNIDLLFDDYDIVSWPADKIHSRHFPYVLIRLGFGVYSPVAISRKFASYSEKKLIETYKDFVDSYGYTSCLVISENRCFYIEPGGKVTESDEPPTGGNIVDWWKFQDGLIKTIDVTDDKKIFYTEDEEGGQVIIPS